MKDINEVNWANLWSAEDGSTYWARSDHGAGSVDQENLSAMRPFPDANGQVPNHLAQCAYDARLYRYGAKSMAQSPAIDRGTDDAYGYDSTSTNPKVIDMGQPDIGYHYYRRVADDDPIDDPENPQLIEFTFQQPDLSGFMLEKYIVPNENPLLPDIHKITENDQLEGDVVMQEGFKGKKTVTGELRNKLLSENTHTVKLITRANSQDSEPAEVIVIVDPYKPTISLEQD